MPIEHMSNQHVLELVGSRFLAARLNKDITQQELASRAGVTQKTISKSGERRQECGSTEHYLYPAGAGPTGSAG